MCRIGAGYECLLPETGEDRLATFDIGWSARGDNEELARFGGIRISEDWRCDIALAMTCMLFREARCGGGAYRTMER